MLSNRRIHLRKEDYEKKCSKYGGLWEHFGLMRRQVHQKEELLFTDALSKQSIFNERSLRWGIERH